MRWGAELHRLEGIALCGLNRPERAEAAFQEALRVARRQQARGDECGSRPASRDCGANREGGPKPAISWHPFTAGSPRGLIPPT
jgi:hypothetical protein